MGGEGLSSILDEEAKYASELAAEATFNRIAVVLVGLLAVIPGLASVVYVFARYGKEPRVDYDREYEQEPPSEHEPALVAALLSQGTVKTEAFVATMFDLISRGVIAAQPVSYDRSTWLGLRTESITDLELSLTDKDESLTRFEGPVRTILRRVLDEGPLPLTELRTGIRDDASKNAESYTAFKKHVLEALARKGLLVDDGKKALLAAAGVTLGILGVTFLLSLAFFSGISAVVLRVGLIIAGFTNLTMIGVFAAFRRGWVHRSAEGALLAARWGAFKRYLEDFSRLEEAPVISLDLWDRYLVYAVALGVAEDVLAAARISAPVEVQNSSLYWYGDPGHGRRAQCQRLRRTRFSAIWGVLPTVIRRRGWWLQRRWWWRRRWRWRRRLVDLPVHLRPCRV